MLVSSHNSAARLETWNGQADSVLAETKSVWSSGVSIDCTGIVVTKINNLVTRAKITGEEANEFLANLPNSNERCEILADDLDRRNKAAHPLGMPTLTSSDIRRWRKMDG
jgi:hypothetical protein